MKEFLHMKTWGNIPYKDAWKLYIMHFVLLFISQSWKIGVILFLATITENSFFLISFVGLLSSFMTFFSIPRISSMISHNDRLQVSQMLLILQCLFMPSAFVICTLPWEIKPLNIIRVSILALLYAGADISCSIISICLEKDWIVVLSAGSSDWLNKITSDLATTALVGEVLTPMILGILFIKYNIYSLSIILIFGNIIFSLGLIVFMRRLYISWPPLSYPMQSDMDASWALGLYRSTYGISTARSVSPHSSNSTLCTEATQPTSTHTSSIHTLISSTHTVVALHDRNNDSYSFFKTGSVCVMSSYAILYISILCFGSILTVFLLYSGVDVLTICLCRAATALMGFTGARLYPIISRRLGTWFTALGALWILCLLVVIATAVFFYKPVIVGKGEGEGHWLWLWLFLGLLICTRSLLAIFDLSIHQIVHDNFNNNNNSSSYNNSNSLLSENDRERSYENWTAMIGVCDMMIYGLCLIVRHPEYFGIPVLTSVLTCVTSTCVFTYACYCQGGVFTTSKTTQFLLPVTVTDKARYNNNNNNQCPHQCYQYTQQQEYNSIISRGATSNGTTNVTSTNATATATAIPKSSIIQILTIPIDGNIQFTHKYVQKTKNNATATTSNHNKVRCRSAGDITGLSMNMSIFPSFYQFFTENIKQIKSTTMKQTSTQTSNNTNDRRTLLGEFAPVNAKTSSPISLKYLQAYKIPQRSSNSEISL
eukprot:gene1994-3882_t